MTDEADVGIWSPDWEVDPELQASFAGLVDAVRRLQDAVAGCRPTIQVADRAAGAVIAATELLEPFGVGEEHQISGRQASVDGRGQTLVPPLHYDFSGPDGAQARVTFTRFHLGGGGAAHGGVLPLVFDELFGQLAVSAERPRSRTAYLNVNYRSITPLGTELQLRGTVSGVRGRKIWIQGTLHDGERLLCDAEGLFLMLLPGQP